MRLFCEILTHGDPRRIPHEQIGAHGVVSPLDGSGRQMNFRIILRRAFTLVELLVVIGIISLLVGMVLPAVQSSRSSARNVQCKSRMRQTFLAAASYSTNRERFPAYGRFECGSGHAVQRQSFCRPIASWALSVMPYLDHASISDRWRNDEAWSSRSNRNLCEVGVSVLLCPSDVTSAGRGLSYVINSGYADLGVLDAYDVDTAAGPRASEHHIHAHDRLQFDWNADGRVNFVDASTTRATGMAWAQRGQKNESMQIPEVHDGLTNTILFAENLNAGIRRNWSDPAIGNCAFVYPVYRPRASGKNFANPPTPEGYTGLPNRERRYGEGTPFPSSGHKAHVNVAYAAGAIKSLSDQVDGSVYRALMTPAGTKNRFPGFLAERPTGTP